MGDPLTSLAFLGRRAPDWQRAVLWRSVQLSEVMLQWLGARCIWWLKEICAGHQGIYRKEPLLRDSTVLSTVQGLEKYSNEQDG